MKWTKWQNIQFLCVQEKKKRSTHHYLPLTISNRFDIGHENREPLNAHAIRFSGKSHLSLSFGRQITMKDSHANNVLFIFHLCSSTITQSASMMQYDTVVFGGHRQQSKQKHFIKSKRTKSFRTRIEFTFWFHKRGTQLSRPLTQCHKIAMRIDTWVRAAYVLILHLWWTKKKVAHKMSNKHYARKLLLSLSFDAACISIHKWVGFSALAHVACGAAASATIVGEMGCCEW